MLLFSMSVSLDGYIADRAGSLVWSAPDQAVFASHLARVGSLGGFVMGRRFYDTLHVWESDPRVQVDDDTAQFAQVWTALPKVVFSRTRKPVTGNARLATGTVAEEIRELTNSTSRDVEIGGASLAGQAMRDGLVDELHMYRYPVVLGGGAPLFTPGDDPQAFTLISAHAFDQVIFERHRRAGVPGERPGA